MYSVVYYWLDTLTIAFNWRKKELHESLGVELKWQFHPSHKSSIVSGGYPMREILERELIKRGLGHMLGEPEYYYPSTKFTQGVWRGRVKRLIDAWDKL